jgi:hypothetical protein
LSPGTLRVFSLGAAAWTMSPEDFRTLGWKSGQRQRARYDTEAMASRERNDHPSGGTSRAVDDDYREFLLWDVAGAFWSLPLREREKIAGALVAGEDLGEVWRDQMRIVGIVEAQRTTLVRLLTLKFGPLSGDLVTKIYTMKSQDELDACLVHVLTAQALEDMGLRA